MVKMLPLNGSINQKINYFSHSILSYQTGINYCFTDSYWNPLHNGISCRDVMVGISVCELARVSSITMFSLNFPYTGKVFTSSGTVKLLMEPRKNYWYPSIEEYRKKLQLFLNCIEKRINLKPTQLFVTTHNYIGVVADERWIKTPYLFSLYLSFLRLGHLLKIQENYENLDTLLPVYENSSQNIWLPSEYNDIYYLSLVWEYIREFLNEGKIYFQEIPFIEPKTTINSTIGMLGFKNFLQQKII